MLALALSLLSLGAFVTAQGLLGTPKPVCPLASGTFNELYAVAIYLANEDLMEEAELCLVDAIAASMPAFTLLSDINTVNGESPPHAPLQLCLGQKTKTVGGPLSRGHAAAAAARRLRHRPGLAGDARHRHQKKNNQVGGATNCSRGCRHKSKYELLPAPASLRVR